MSRVELFETGKKIIINGHVWTIVPIPKKPAKPAKPAKRSKKET